MGFAIFRAWALGFFGVWDFKALGFRVLEEKIGVCGV